MTPGRAYLEALDDARDMMACSDAYSRQCAARDATQALRRVRWRLCRLRTLVTRGAALIIVGNERRMLLREIDCWLAKVEDERAKAKA